MRTGIKQLGWMVILWTASVLTLGVVGFLIRLLLKP